MKTRRRRKPPVWHNSVILTGAEKGQQITSLPFALVADAVGIGIAARYAHASRMVIRSMRQKVKEVN